MIERRLAGRRFIDFHPEAAHPLYPNELERRFAKRRAGDREGALDGAAALRLKQRRLPPILWNGIARCATCGKERQRARNLSRDGRKRFIIEHVFGPRAESSCECEDARTTVEWIAQAGTE